MKQFFTLSKRSLWSILSAAFLLATCARRQPDITPADDDVRLLSVNVAGLPSGNISIDQAKKEVVLTVPTSLSTVTFDKVTFQSTPGSSVWQADQRQLNLCQMGNAPLYVLSEKKASIYTFVVKPAGPLSIGFLDNYPKATIGQGLTLRINNLIDGTGGGVVVLTNADTGEEDSLRAYCCTNNSSTYVCQSNGSQYELGVPNRIRPGNYVVSVISQSGRAATAPQKLTFLKGKPAIRDVRNALTIGQPVTIEGSNLFADDAPELWLRRSSGETIRIKPTGVSPYGWSLTANLPATMSPGYYDMQLGYANQPAATGQRVVIRRNDRQPSIVRIGEGWPTALSAEPLVLQRGQAYSATILPQIATFAPLQVRLDVKLTAIGGSAQSAQFLFTAQAYNGDYPPGLTVPTTVKPGLYTMHVVATYNDGVVSESEPLERPVEVR